jgi:CheY-like chemotaxis protein
VSKYWARGRLAEVGMALLQRLCNDSEMSVSGTTSQRILVVDDEPMVCDSVRMMLVGDGHEVETAGSGEAALAIFEERRFDLVIVDYELPLMNGDKVAVAIKALDPNQPIVLITAYAEALQSAATPLPGVALVIGKPFDAHELCQAVTRLLKERVRPPGAARGQ